MVLHNDHSLVEELRIWQRRAGGRPFALAFEVTDCERGFHEIIHIFSRKEEKVIRVVREISYLTAMRVNSNGEKTVRFVPNVLTCCEVLTYFDGFNESALLAARDKVEQQLSVRISESLRPLLDMMVNINSTETEARLLHRPPLARRATMQCPEAKNKSSGASDQLPSRLQMRCLCKHSATH
jgi:hypothetical protein